MGLVVATSAPAHAATFGMRRIAVIVGANEPPPDRPALRFAHDDASELARVLEQVGGFSQSDVHLLLDPHPVDLIATLDSAARTTVASADDVLFVFYYSGHSDGQALFPHGEPIALADVRERLERLGARIRVGILDTCRGGSWTQSKGLSVGPPLATADLLNVDTEGTALVSSSSGLEDAHEADSVRGSFFTHHFAAALRGAADREGDGNVTLQEAFDYARDRTVRDSARLAKTPQHPSFDLALRGRQDIVLAVLPTRTSALQIKMARAPIEIIQLPSGVTVADVPAQGGLRIALPPGRYLARSVVDGRVYAKEVEVRPGETSTLADGELEAIGNEQLAIKGSDEEAPVQRAPDLRLTAIVHIEADRPVVLERSERNGPWVPACSSPCDRDLPISSMYRVLGAGVRASIPFQLAARAGERIVVRVSSASKVRFIGGFVIAGLGLASVGVGALVLENKQIEALGYGSRTDDGPSKTAGQIMMVGGATAMLGGVLLTLFNRNSTLEQSPQATPPRNDAWLRDPTWRQDRVVPRTAMGASMLQLTF
jgi:hypothetical protein